MRKKNAAGEREMRHHIKDVKAARSSLKERTGKLKDEIGKKITGALKQDHKVLRDMQRVDKK